MPINVTIPEVGESITEGILSEWTKADGELVARDEPLLVLETDKITMNVNAAQSGRLKILVAAGTTVQIGQTVATIDTDVQAEPPAAPVTRPAAPTPPTPAPPPAAATTPPPRPAAAPPAPAPITPPAGMPQAAHKLETAKGLSPAVQRMVLEHHLDPAAIAASGRDGRLTKGDVLRHLQAVPPPAAAEPPAHPTGTGGPAPAPEPAAAPVAVLFERQTRQPLSPLRQRIAERLVEVQQTAAILTTFNEVDLSRVIELRTRFKDSFKERHGVGLGFMSFFVKASIDALRFVPQVNAYIDGDQLVTNHYYDIGIAVSTDRGLVVPVLRDADQLSMAEIEVGIADLASRAQQRRLELSELTGAVFTISNGGVFGSMMSTPILNPPGSAILGMHAIIKRPVVVDDQIVIRPMMYLAVSYDHRVIDGRESVTFLKRIKDCLEDPSRLLLEV
jgi:2-oxoglutarate dehydrogenase E2 component (dihydrolipoamide succinyltransferase)